MIRVELGEEVEWRGVWLYGVPQFAVWGRSRQPLLDACRQIKSLDEATASQQIGLETMVRFTKWKPFRMDAS
jgi:hypothetical protein